MGAFRVGGGFAAVLVGVAGAAGVGLAVAVGVMARWEAAWDGTGAEVGCGDQLVGEGPGAHALSRKTRAPAADVRPASPGRLAITVGWRSTWVGDQRTTRWHAPCYERCFVPRFTFAGRPGAARPMDRAGRTSSGLESWQGRLPGMVLQVSAAIEAVAR